MEGHTKNSESLCVNKEYMCDDDIDFCFGKYTKDSQFEFFSKGLLNYLTFYFVPYRVYPPHPRTPIYDVASGCYGNTNDIFDFDSHSQKPLQGNSAPETLRPFTQLSKVLLLLLISSTSLLSQLLLLLPSRLHP